MSNVNRYILKLNDKDVLRAFDSVANQFNELGVTLTCSDNMGQIGAQDLKRYAGSLGYLLRSINLRIGEFNWTWSRQEGRADNPHSANYDLLQFGWDGQQGVHNREVAISVGSALSSALGAPLITNAGENADLGYYASQKEILLALEGAVAQHLSDASRHRGELEASYREKEVAATKRADEVVDRELIRIAEERARIEAELSKRQEGLDEKQAFLDALQKKLDDRNNTHVRRDIRASLLELTKERLANFSVSKETRLQYRTVNYIALLGILLLAGGTFFYGALAFSGTNSTDSVLTIALAIKSSLLAAATIALGAWYLKWLNRWLQRIADAEFRLQQFRLDIERASWLAETVLEWKVTSSEPFPELLAARLSAGLFQSASDEVDDPKAPAAQLAEALFGAAASAKINIGGNEVSFDRKSIKKLDDKQ